MERFKLVSEYQPTGDQPQAIEKLAKGFEEGNQFETLVGVTGSGKTFTMANIIERVQKPTLIISHNKTLAAQLYGEMKEFFPENAVEYFVSYYDYYQPEAYVPSSDTYIAKDSAINDEIDKLRHSATAALSERRDVIIVASVSCIYGLGAPVDYQNMVISLRPGMEKDRDDVIRKLIDIQYVRSNGTNAEKLGTLKEVLSASEVGLKGVEESEFILNTLETMGLKNEIELDLTLARGLNYYTGAIFEVKALDVQIGSITGGGRYDNLTGVFGMSGVSGVGISFGADRIFDVLNQLELYPKEAVNGTEVLFINFGEKEAAFSMGVLAKVRAAGIRAEIFPDASKMKKQMSYANAKNIPFVAIVGENEMNEGKVMLKNMETGEQNLVSAEELIAAVKR